MPQRFEGTVDEYIASRITVTVSGCWLWGQVKPQGYGEFRCHGVIKVAHVGVWEHYNGPLPSDKILRHTCDNRPCVNPDHQVPGTKKDNRRDFMERHPRASEIMKKVGDKAHEGLREFWAGMSSAQRKEFSEKRSAAQSARGSRKHSPETRARIKASWIKRRKKYGHNGRPGNMGSATRL